MRAVGGQRQAEGWLKRLDKSVAVSFNHTIIGAHDLAVSAEFYKVIIGAKDAPSWGPFTNLQLPSTIRSIWIFSCRRLSFAMAWKCCSGLRLSTGQIREWTPG